METHPARSLRKTATAKLAIHAVTVPRREAKKREAGPMRPDLPERQVTLPVPWSAAIRVDSPRPAARALPL
jgi:hypothetical protein